MNKGAQRARRFVGGYFDKGDVTDENADLVLMSGLIPRQDLFRLVTSVTSGDGPQRQTLWQPIQRQQPPM